MTDFIEVYDDALDPELCAAVVEKFGNSQPSRGVTGSGVALDWKDSHDINISRAEDWQELHAKVMNATTGHLLRYMQAYPYLLTGAIGAGRVDPETGEQTHFNADDLDQATAAQLMMRLYRPGEISAQHYTAGTGGYHHWHSEIYPRSANCETLHRVLLFMFYMNTVTEGGETEFKYQGRKIEPLAGRMVIAPAGFTHTHKGHVPVSEDKLILTSWVLFNRAEVIYKQPG
jgi:hypothetical protein